MQLVGEAHTITLIGILVIGVLVDNRDDLLGSDILSIRLTRDIKRRGLSGLLALYRELSLEVLLSAKLFRRQEVSHST